jgi:hypothetical protein
VSRLSVPPVFVDGFTVWLYAALYAAVVPPPVLPLALVLALVPLLGVEPPLLDDGLLLQPLITMAAATAMPIAADRIRCRIISCTPLFLLIYGSWPG